MGHQLKLNSLDFCPLTGLYSSHLQTILAIFTPSGEPPSSSVFIFPLGDGDSLMGYISTPPEWMGTDKTIILIHGLAGDRNSGYMVRLSRKLYQQGHRVIRLNMRSAGFENPKMSRLYHAGASSDVHTVLTLIKEKHPLSPITLIGFSCSGNVVLKLAGELGNNAETLLETTIAICSPLDLKSSAELLERPSNRFYNRYYTKYLNLEAKNWLNGHQCTSLIEYDNLITAPQWGYKDAFEYYEKCSGLNYLSKICHPCHLVFAADDPFIDHKVVQNCAVSSNVHGWLSPYGGHMGFLGWTAHKRSYHWLDDLLLNWIKGDFTTNCSDSNDVQHSRALV